MKEAICRYVTTLAVLVVVMFLSACGSDIPVVAIPGVMVAFDLSGGWTGDERYFAFPLPSDLRIKAGGEPDLTGMPNQRKNKLVDSLRRAAEQRKGFPVIPVAYFSFDGKLAPREVGKTIAAAPTSPVLLVDVDAASSSRGTLYPTVAALLDKDDFTPVQLFAAAPRPGIVLRAKTRYAFVLLRSLKDGSGNSLGVPLAMEKLKAGQVPDGPQGEKAAKLYAPLWVALDQAGVERAQVAAATVFTTGDVVGDLAALSKAVRAKHPVTLTDLKLDPDDGDHPRYCELLAKVRYPQFQRGKPPFATDGLFDFDEKGAPKKQREEMAPVVISIPKKPMPADGYPLLIYVHGSGGLSSQLVDRGQVKVKGGKWTKGEGPAHVLAPQGLALAGSAMPVNPERYLNAGDYEYLNPINLPALRDTFRQGILEQGLLIDALLKLEIPLSALGTCKGPTLSGSATSLKFSPKGLAVMGQSMGGMYTTLLAAVDPRMGAAVPTGAGGFWSYYMFRSTRIPGTLINLLLGTWNKMTFMHPAVHVMQTAWEAAEPLVYAPRVSRRPLDGHPSRHVYEPVGKGDSYFGTEIFDAMALAFGNEQAGAQVWPTMQTALKLSGMGGMATYPVKNNLKSEEKSGVQYTGVVAQYEGDGIYDPHAIAFQLDTVKHQYSCFLQTFFQTGTAVVPAPAKLGTTCAK